MRRPDCNYQVTAVQVAKGIKDLFAHTYPVKPYVNVITNFCIQKNQGLLKKIPNSLKKKEKQNSILWLENCRVDCGYVMWCKAGAKRVYQESALLVAELL